jgi:hypothetical protein
MFPGKFTALDVIKRKSLEKPGGMLKYLTPVLNPDTSLA